MPRPDRGTGPAGRRLTEAVRTAFVLATERTYVVLAIVLGVTAIALLIWAPRKPCAPDHPAARSIEAARDTAPVVD